MRPNPRFARRLASVTVVVGAILINGCGSSGSGPKKSAEDFANDGWSDFDASNYVSALADFQEAIARDAEYAPAYLGAGWASLLNDNPNSAINYLDDGDQFNDDEAMAADFIAGLALSYFETGNYPRCIKLVDSCLTLDPDFSFSRDSEIDSDDLKYAQAISYFQLGGDANLEMSADIVHDLDSSIDLDAEDPSSWKVGGVSYSTFSEALLRALEHFG